MPTSDIFQLKITLKDTQPAVWRRVLIAADAAFRDLHEAIQLSFGWTDSHLHEFYTEKDKRSGMFLGGKIADPRNEEFSDGYGEPPANENMVKLRDRLLEVDQRIAYTYDFGDTWDHEIHLEKILEPEGDREYPVCVAGKRACPPDDCGGTGGYYRLLEILADPKHKEHEDMLEWLCLESADEFDPDECDIETINELLRDGYAAWAPMAV